MLLVINGAPGISTSTLARQYVDGIPLALLVEIDEVRMQLGGWADRDESRIVARALALDLMRSHLASGEDVLVPQFLGRPQNLTEMSDVAAATGTAFVEVCLACASDVLIERFRTRRGQYAQWGVDHPQSDLEDASVVAELTRSNDQVVRDGRSRGSVIVAVDGEVEDSLDCLRVAVGTVTG